MGWPQQGQMHSPGLAQQRGHRPLPTEPLRPALRLPGPSHGSFSDRLFHLSLSEIRTRKDKHEKIVSVDKEGNDDHSDYRLQEMCKGRFSRMP